MADAIYPTLTQFIAGRWTPAEGRETSPVIDPASGAEIGRLPHATAQDLDDALAAADGAAAVWRRTPAIDRYRIIRKAADLLRERRSAGADPHPGAGQAPG